MHGFNCLFATVSILCAKIPNIQHVNGNRVNQIFLILFSRTIELERMKEANKTVKVKVHSRDLDQVCRHLPELNRIRRSL